MSAKDIYIYIFLQNPFVNILIYTTLLVLLIFSFRMFKKGKSEYKYVFISFLLIVLSLIVHNSVFIFHIHPKNIIGKIVILLIIILPALASFIFIFYSVTRIFKKRK